MKNSEKYMQLSRLGYAFGLLWIFMAQYYIGNILLKVLYYAQNRFKLPIMRNKVLIMCDLSPILVHFWAI